MLTHFKESCARSRESLEGLLSKMRPENDNDASGHFRDQRVLQESRSGASECYLGIDIQSYLSRSIQSNLNDRVRCIVTDSEAAINQISMLSLLVDPCSHVLCELHLRSNVEMLLKQCDANKEVRNEITAIIFEQELQMVHGRERKCDTFDIK
ncbi:unnamed protein product [Gongylonema pulchrum]|uniref:MULE domain-containing protein n=1 Tax=Gongylonema pulchrum TaxID=637853 RepID=A0A183EVX4_9BILA|nr:unnamed protein product [Gongylonema pulchrum]